MSNEHRRRILGGLVAAVSVSAAAAEAPEAQRYEFLFGNNHAHSSVTESHGEMLDTNDCKGVAFYLPDPAQGNRPDWLERPPKVAQQCPAILVLNGWQYRGPQTSVKANAGEVQGPPSTHYRTARDLGFDWYAVTDHSQEAAFSPEGANNLRWNANKREADAATGNGFVGIAGYEYSENDGPGITGHYNVLNSVEVRNAMLPGIDVPAFYKWLESAQGADGLPLVVAFNHPSEDDVNRFGDRTGAATQVISLLELINGDRRAFEASYFKALDAGWRVSPIAGIDNHGLTPLPKAQSRGVVLAVDRSRKSVLEAMRARRTYATFDPNLRAHYTVDHTMMGSVVKPTGKGFSFDIRAEDPGKDAPGDRIAKIDILKDGGELVASKTFKSPTAKARWQHTVNDPSASYFVVRIWNARGSSSDASRAGPVAWLAPVWTTPHPWTEAGN